jgi:hypothetical protein
MKAFRPSWQGSLAALLALMSLLFLPVMRIDGWNLFARENAILANIMIGIILVVALADAMKVPLGVKAAAVFVAAHLVVWLLIMGLAPSAAKAGPAFYLLLAACWLLAWRCVALLSSLPATAFLRLLIPAIFGAWVLILWEAIVQGANIPFILLPPPSAIWMRITDSLPVLWADVNQTIFKAVLAGYVIGCSAGFATAILADRFDFLRRGLIPIGNMVSALPIIGVAPIMVLWFGFDWPSKAAVVVIMTFFSDAGEHRRRAGRVWPYRARPDADLRVQLLADALETPASGRSAFHIQRFENQLHTGADRRNCRRVFRHASGGHGFPHLFRDGEDECRHGVGRNCGCSPSGFGLLWRHRSLRKSGHILAPVRPWWTGVKRRG